MDKNEKAQGLESPCFMFNAFLGHPLVPQPVKSSSVLKNS